MPKLETIYFTPSGLCIALDAEGKSYWLDICGEPVWRSILFGGVTVTWTTSE